MEVVPQETETVDDAAHVEDRLPSCCLTSAFQNATSRLPAAMKVAASDAMLGHLEELSACLDAACRGHVDEAGFARMWTAAHAAKEITPSSPPIKDLAQSVRNIVLCHILSTVGYTSRAADLRVPRWKAAWGLPVKAEGNWPATPRLKKSGQRGPHSDRRGNLRADRRGDACMWFLLSLFVHLVLNPL